MRNESSLCVLCVLCAFARGISGKAVPQAPTKSFTHSILPNRLLAMQDYTLYNIQKEITQL